MNIEFRRVDKSILGLCAECVPVFNLALIYVPASISSYQSGSYEEKSRSNLEMRRVVSNNALQDLGVHQCPVEEAGERGIIHDGRKKEG